MRKSGLALIVVIGILGVLAVLAVAFVMMAQLERRASEQRVNAARAYLLARSGIEDTLARLALGQDPVYGGEDWQGDGDQGPGSFDHEQEVYRRGELNVDDCPVRQALRPSFFATDRFVPPRPLLLDVDGRKRGYSGGLSGDYAPKGNAYALKAGAEGSEGHGFYINGGDPSFISNPTQTSDYNMNLRRMLGILARAIAEDAVGALGGLASSGNVGNAVAQLTLTESDGWALIDARPKTDTGWQNWEQVRKLALGGSQAKLDVLKPYLTLHAWTDKKVIAPNVTAAMLKPNRTAYNTTLQKYEPAKTYPNWGEFKLDHTPTSATSCAPDFERIPQEHAGKIVGRAPVNLSWVRHKLPALIALLGGLKGFYLDETPAAVSSDRAMFGVLRAAEVFLAWDPTDLCHKVADRILTSTSELTTWQQWHDFCDALPDSVVMSTSDYALFLTYSTANSATTLALSNPTNNSTVSFGAGAASYYLGLQPQVLSLWLKGQAVRDLLKANFNPNSGLNKFSPNASMWKLVDKGDLLVYSTEFSLLPISYDHQEASSVGRVVDHHGRLLASRVLKALLASPPPVRLTTQTEFVSEDLGALDIAGDESGYRLPGQAGGPFITASQGSGKTWGHALGQPGLGGQGASLQTYPEPVVDDSTLSINPADYDGSIQLATVETAQDSNGFYGATGTTDQTVLPLSGTPYRKMMMLARYTGNFDLDVADADQNGSGSRSSPLYVNAKQNHPDFYQVTSHCTGQPGQAISQGPFYQPAQQTDEGRPRLEELRFSLLHAENKKLNTLYPDGCYAELNRAPEYLDKGNANGFHGVMSFWIKANHAPPTGSLLGGGAHGKVHPFVKWTNFSSSRLDGSDQFFFWGDQRYSNSSSFPLVCQFEIGHSKSDAGNEHRFEVGRFLIPHRWELMTLRWDFLASQANDIGEMVIGAGTGASDRSSRNTYNSSAAPTLASDITVDDLQWDGSTGPHRIGLGRGHSEWEVFCSQYTAAGADATFDEFALYDFGGAALSWTTDVPPKPIKTPASGATKASPEVLAAARFPEGRHYKGSAYAGLNVSVGENDRAGEWFSAPIHLGGGPVRLRGLAWTQVVPRGLRSPLPPPSTDTVSGVTYTPQPGVDGDPDVAPDGTPSPDAAIFFELVNETGTAYALDLGGNQLLTNPAFTTVNRELRGPFRLHAVFQPNLADPINTPILDPLTLDDVTLYYEPLSGPRVTAFGEGEQ